MEWGANKIQLWLMRQHQCIWNSIESVSNEMVQMYNEQAKSDDSEKKL